MHNTYRLAGHTVKIESLYPQVHTLCADYRTDDPPEYVITTTEADIAFERAKSARENIQEGAPVQEYEDSYLETLAVYRKLAQVLVQEDVLLMHGAVVAVDGQAYLITREGATVYGTPWDGKEHLSHNIACPLKAVCILTRSKTNHIVRISPKEALRMLCQQSYRPAQPAALRKTLALIDLLSSSVPLYRLGCNMEPEAALVAYHGMNQ